MDEESRKHKRLVRQTVNGNLLIQTHKGGGQEVLKKLKGNMKGAAIRTVGENKAGANIFDVEITSTVEDIMTAIKNTFGEVVNKETIEVRNLRPQNQGNQQATIYATPSIITKLCEKRWIRVGLTEAKIKIKPENPMCTRCWGMKHEKGICNRCRKCGEQGHFMRECPKSSFFCQGPKFSIDIPLKEVSISRLLSDVEMIDFQMRERTSNVPKLLILSPITSSLEKVLIMFSGENFTTVRGT